MVREKLRKEVNLKVSKYTTELRFIVEDENFDLGMDTYPLFSENYRETLNSKIINHYYFYEIGVETAGRFKFNLNVNLHEIMPYYNKLYQSELLTINPLLSFSRTSNVTKEVESGGESTVESTQTNNNKDVFSDTPDGLLSIGNIETNVYASEARIVNDEANKTDTSTGTSNSTETNVITENGYEVPLSELITKYRDTFLNVDMMIIKELRELFMMIY